jgi:hypothetical protein
LVVESFLLCTPYVVGVSDVDGMEWYWWLAVAVFAVLGIWTLIPAQASRPCLLGYYAHCSFTPVSTLICWAIAGIIYWLGRRRGR